MATPETFRKLTDPVIPTQNGTVALDDLLHTVDVSDTSKGAAGTSKRTAVQKIVDAVQSSLNLESGEWSPILSNFSGAILSASVDKAIYSRLGNIVTCSINGEIEIDITVANSGGLNFTYPIEPSGNNSIGGSIGFRGLGVNSAVSSWIRFNEFGIQSGTGIYYGSVQYFANFQYQV